MLLQGLCEEDEKAFEMFMSSDAVVKTTVAESLKEKLTAKQTELGSRMSGKSVFVLCLAIILFAGSRSLPE